MDNQKIFNKTSLGRILAITASIASIFALILYCVLSIESASDIGKVMVPMQISFVMIGAILFAIYYLGFYSSGSYPALVPAGIACVGVGILLSPIQTFSELMTLVSDAGRYMDTSPYVWSGLGAMAIPTIVSVLVFFSAYLIYKGNTGKYLAFLVFPIGYYTIYTIIASVNSLNSYLFLYTCCLLCIMLSFLVFGFDINSNERPANTASSASLPSNADKIEEKLQLAQESYVNGIINEEEFAELRQRILSEL